MDDMTVDEFIELRQLLKTRIGSVAISAQMTEKFGRAPDRVVMRNLGFDQRLARQNIRAEAECEGDARFEIEDHEDIEVMQFGSNALLSALWREHPEVMQRLRDKGLNVIDPQVDGRLIK